MDLNLVECSSLVENQTHQTKSTLKSYNVNDSLLFSKFSTSNLGANASNAFNDFNDDYSSLYFEAIDLCMPLTFTNAQFTNEPTSNFLMAPNACNQPATSYSSSSSSYGNQFNANSSYNNVGNSQANKFLNLNHNPNDAQRCNSVPVNLLFVNCAEETLESANMMVDKPDNVNMEDELLLTNFITNEEENLMAVSTHENLINDNYLDKSPIENLVQTNVNSTQIASLTDANQNVALDLKQIMQNLVSKVYTCLSRNCGKQFKLEADLIEHLNSEHYLKEQEDKKLKELTRQSFKCSYRDLNNQMCSKIFESLLKLAHHVCKNHSFKHILPSYEKDNGIQLSANEREFLLNENTFKLNKFFIKEDCLKLHKKEAHNLQSAPKSKKHADHIMKCPLCEMTFSRPIHLRTHMNSHETSKMKFECSYCGEKFPKQANLLSHLSTSHKNTPKIFKKAHISFELRCPHENCVKEFSCKMYLDSHITKIHSQASNGNNASASTPSSLATKNFYCSQCDKYFEQNWLKRQHDELKHNPNQRIFKCTHENCNKTFANASKLHRHVKIHSKLKLFKCEMPDCDVAFARKEHLTAHMNFHSNKKQFKCDFKDCKSSFRYHSNLITHKKSAHKQDQSQANTQSSEDAFSKLMCNYCGLKFDNNEKLQFHVKIHFDITKANEKLNEYLTVSQTNNQPDMVVSSDQFYYPIMSSNSLHNQQSEGQNLSDCPNHQPTLDMNQIDKSISNSTQTENHEPNRDQNQVEINDFLITDIIDVTNNFLTHASNSSESHTDSSSSSSSSQNAAGFMQFLNTKEQPTATGCNQTNKPGSTFGNFDFEQSHRASKSEHIITINSDDEEYTTCSVVLENLSGSARTDYKSNHTYIEKYKSKRKLRSQSNEYSKRLKEAEDESSNESCQSNSSHTNTTASKPKNSPETTILSS